jgi:hypothetical protein
VFTGVLTPINFHSAHFENEFATSLTPLTYALGTQANLLPLASPSSGVLLTYDSALKTFVASTDDSLGPVLGERADTIGRHRLFLGFSYQYFDINKIDGINLQSIPDVLTHTDDNRDNSPSSAPTSINCSITAAGSSLGGCGFIRDRIETQNSISLTENQYTAYVTFGLTRHIDISAVIPFVNVNMSLTTQATIVPGTNGNITPTPTSPDATAFNQCTLVSGSPNCATNGAPYFFHTFKNCPNTSPSSGNLDPACLNHAFPDPAFTGSTSSTPNNSVSGIGDVVARVKWNAWHGERAGAAVGLDVRFPSGDALNFLGSGAYGFKPFAVFSYRARVSPHVVVGYEWNTNSVTAGDLIAGTTGKLPNEFFYTVGADARATKWLTVDFDIVGQRFFNSEIISVTQQSFLANCGTCVANPATPYDMRNSLLSEPIEKVSYNVTYASPGIKARIIPGYPKLVLTGSVLIRLNDMGLVSRPAPLVGLGYTF